MNYLKEQKLFTIVDGKMVAGKIGRGENWSLKIGRGKMVVRKIGRREKWSRGSLGFENCLNLNDINFYI